MEQIEYASFVQELATAGLNSPRCPPETKYAQEFEHRMEALLVNCEITDDVTYGKPSSQRTEQESNFLGSCSSTSGMAKTSSLLEDNDEAMSDGSASESDQERKPYVSTYQRSNTMDYQCSVDSGHGHSTRNDSFRSVNGEQAETDMDHESKNSLKKALSFEHMNISFRNEMLDMAEEICTINPPLNATVFTPKTRLGPAKRTYDEANS